MRAHRAKVRDAIFTYRSSQRRQKQTQIVSAHDMRVDAHRAQARQRNSHVHIVATTSKTDAPGTFAHEQASMRSHRAKGRDAIFTYRPSQRRQNKYCAFEFFGLIFFSGERGIRMRAARLLSLRSTSSPDAASRTHTNTKTAAAETFAPNEISAKNIKPTRSHCDLVGFDAPSEK